MAFAFDQNRDASATIAGFVFQIYTTALRWLDLREGEELHLEAGEDIDTVRTDLEAGTYQENRTLEQIKRRQGPLTLRSPSALEALSNFNDHRLQNPDTELRFRYVTTALATVEKGWAFDQGGIPTWEAIRVGELAGDELQQALDSIQRVLLAAAKPAKVQDSNWASFQTSIASKQTLHEIIVGLEWSVANDDYPAVELKIKEALVQSGLASPANIQDRFDRLVVFVLLKLSTSGAKVLTIQTLQTALHQAISNTDRTLLEALQLNLAALNVRLAQVEERVSTLEGSLDLKAVVAALAARENFTALVNLAPRRIVLEVPEIVRPSIPRAEVVSLLCDALKSKGYSHLTGEPGSGKTQLALLTAKALNLGIVYIDVPRASSSQTACEVIDASIEAATGIAAGPTLRPWYEVAARTISNRLVIVDNVPATTAGDAIARRLEVLAGALARSGSKLITISYYPLPRRTLENAQATELAAPRFTEEETVELLVAFGGSESIAVGLKTLIQTATQGLAVMVVAVANFLASRGWTFDLEQFESILKAEFAQGERSDARSLVRLTVPDDDTRELLYRLTLVIGGISKRDVQNVARVGKKISLPLDKLDGLIGLWLQPFIGETFLLSPLIDSSFSGFLDDQTRRATHTILGLSIMSREEIHPLEVLACFHHFTSAALYAQAAIVLFQTLMALVDIDPKETVEGTELLTGLWLKDMPAEIDFDLRVPLRALQIVTLDNRGRDISAMVTDFDQDIRSGSGAGWGKALATSFLAMRFYKKYPERANAYLLLFLQTYRSALLPDGQPMPGVGAHLEELLWATAQSSASDEDVESWIETVEQLQDDEAKRLQESTLAAENATILCDGIWLRDYRKLAGEQDWGRVEALVSKLRGLGHRRQIPTLEAAAIRTLVMLKSEWQDDVDGAIALAEASVPHFLRAEDAFLIVEVMGRQLFYRGRTALAEQWLERALSYPISDHALWRRNVLITLAELRGGTNPQGALALVHQAVELSQKELEPERTAEAYAEEAIANWGLGERLAAFDSLALAINTLPPVETESVTWKQCFAGLFQLAFSYSSKACNFKVGPLANEPAQGMFLGLDNFNISAVNTSQKVIIQVRMAMFAECIGETEKAGEWLDRGLALLEVIPEAKAVRLHAGLGIAPALLARNVVKAVQLGLIMADAEPKAGLELEHVKQLPDEQKQVLNEAIVIGETIQGPVALFRTTMPIAAQLAAGKLNNLTVGHLQQTVDQVSVALDGRPEQQAIVSAFHAAIIDGRDWESSHQLASTLMPDMNTFAVAIIYMIGAALHAPIYTSFGLQVWLVQHIEKFFSDLPSISSKIFYPFLESYWMREVSGQSYSFRTSEAYTRKAIAEIRAGGEPRLWARKLLRGMAFCLSGSVPQQTAAWLNSDNLN